MSVEALTDTTAAGTVHHTCGQLYRISVGMLVVHLPSALTSQSAHLITTLWHTPIPTLLGTLSIARCIYSRLSSSRDCLQRESLQLCERVPCVATSAHRAQPLEVKGCACRHAAARATTLPLVYPVVTARHRPRAASYCSLSATRSTPASPPSTMSSSSSSDPARTDLSSLANKLTADCIDSANARSADNAGNEDSQPSVPLLHLSSASGAHGQHASRTQQLHSVS